MNDQLIMRDCLSLRDKIRLIEIAHQTKDSDIKKHALALLNSDQVELRMPPIEISVGAFDER